MNQDIEPLPRLVLVILPGLIYLAECAPIAEEQKQEWTQCIRELREAATMQMRGMQELSTAVENILKSETGRREPIGVSCVNTSALDAARETLAKFGFKPETRDKSKL